MSRSVEEAGGFSRLALVRLTPLVIFASLAILTSLIWGQQIEHERRLLASHTEDICVQAARRLQVRLDSRLRVASIFAKRWATHGLRDYSRRRFDEFADVLLTEFPEYHSLSLVSSDGQTEWVARGASKSACRGVECARRELLEESKLKRQMLLSGPQKCGTSEACFFAVALLLRDDEFLGHLVVEFRADSMIGEVFHERIQSEFNIQVDDQGDVLFQRIESRDVLFSNALIGAAKSFPIRNRTWRLSITPRQTGLAATGWTANLALPLLGIALSIGLSLLVHLLSRRVELHRLAHGRALREMEEREKTQQALVASEERYRRVFDSATDGLLVIGQDDCILEANPAASAMHHFSSEEFVGRPYVELIDPDHRHLFVEFKNQLEQHGFVRLESVHRTRDAKPLDVEVRGTSFELGGEQVVLAILTDVSERKRALERQAMLSRKVLMAQEEERARVSRDLHDELGQILTALHLELDMLHKAPGPTGSEDDDGLIHAIAMVERAADELRRVCRGLRPPLLDDLGVEPSVRLLVEEFEQRTEIETELEIQIDEDGEPVTSEVALCIYRIVQESLNNVGRHSKASRVRISLVDNGEELHLSIFDNGQGFELADNKGTGGYGIAGMRERAFFVNAVFDINSQPLQGTQVTLRVPRKG